MPVIPITSGTRSAPSPAPSETNMLMALAEMHKQGRFAPSMDINPVPHASAKVGDYLDGLQASPSTSSTKSRSGVLTGVGLY